MANDDKVYEAFHGSMGENFSNKVKNRINWIIENVGDKSNIIDAGCSQGITSFLLGEMGKNVLGIDIQPESIAFANNLLNTKYYEISRNVSFLCMPFENYISQNKAECIIATEVLEHLPNANIFLQKINTNLSDEGRLIITVPFGVNNHPDHYSSFYMLSIFDLINQYFDVCKLEYMDNWIGIVAYKKGKSKDTFKINADSIQKEEKEFLKMNTHLVNTIEDLKKRNTTINEKYKTSCKNYDKVNEWHKSSVSKVKDLSQVNEDLKNMKNALQIELNQSNQMIKDYYLETDKQVEFLRQLQAHIKKLESKNTYLSEENNAYRKKLSKITDTWYGKIAIKAYKVLAKIKRNLKR